MGDVSTFKGSIVGGDSVMKSVYFAVTSGPDMVDPTAGTVCTLPTPRTFECAVPTSGTAGMDNVVFFYSQSENEGDYLASDPQATSKITIAGAVSSVLLTPKTSQAAQAGYAAYTASAVDKDGNPVAGAALTLSGEQKVPVTTPATDPAVIDITAANPVVEGQPTAIFAGAGTSTDAATVTTSNGQGKNAPAGTATVYVASQTVGTVDLKLTPSIAGIVSAGTLTVNKGGINAVTAVAVTPATQNAFTSKVVTETIVVRNAEGDLLSGVTPEVDVTAGPNADQAVTVNGATDGAGMTTATYTATDVAGTDSVLAYVNQTDKADYTNALDSANEPSATASVVLSEAPVFTAPGGLSVLPVEALPTDIGTAPVKFTLNLVNDEGKAAPAAGYKLDFSLLEGSDAKYSLNQENAITDAKGQVTVNVSNSSTTGDDEILVTATLASDATITASTTVVWDARSVVDGDVVITPDVSTNAFGTSVTHTVAATDKFGDAVTGLTYNWTVNDGSTGRNVFAAGTGASFTYADSAVAKTSGSDTLTVTASTNTGGTLTMVGSATAHQVWTASATTATLNLDSSSDEALTSVDPTMEKPFTGELIEVYAWAYNAKPAEEILYNKSVTFTSQGEGTFADKDGNAIAGSTISVPTDSTGDAVVYARSTTTGLQTITASSDGVSAADAVEINYTNSYVGIDPQRVVDTRNGQGSLSTVTGAAAPAQLAPNTNYVFSLAATDLPLGAEAYAFNVTAIGGEVGNLRIAPYTGSTPETSLINYQASKDVANFVVLPNTGNDEFVIYSAGSSVAVAIDVVGYYGTDGITAQEPTRVVDTRTGLGGATNPISGNTSRTFTINAPDGTKSVALNVTAIQPNGQGNLRVYPNGSETPNSSNVNYIPGVDKSAFVIVDLPANGKIDIYSAGGAADVAVDVFATYSESADLVTAAPVRIMDTRTDLNAKAIAAGSMMDVQVTGKADVPADAQAVLVSITGVHNAASTGVGNLRAFPSAAGAPLVSTLNYVGPKSDVANFAIVKLGTDGKISLASFGSVIDATVDVVGYVPASSPAVVLAP